MATVFIPQDVAPEGKRYLTDRGHEIKVASGIDSDTLVREVAGCEAILIRTANLPAAVIEASPKLRVISRHGVGYDNIDMETATRKGVQVTFTPEANSDTVAEYTTGMIVALTRGFVRADRAMRARQWEHRNKFPGMDVAGKTLGIVGYGKIGKRLARRAIAGLDMKVLAYDPYVDPSQMPEGAELTKEWEQVFSQSDVISLHMPGTPETRGIVGAKEFEMMKETAYLINAARGEIVDQAALTAALKSGRIAGAGLDVFSAEPPDFSAELFALDNVIVTPHNAALTVECMRKMAVHAAMGIDEVLSGKKVTWPVNKV
jgi:D-3-phosphoglycerate dehydrogenase